MTKIVESLNTLSLCVFNETVTTFQAKVLEWSLRRLPVSSLQHSEGSWALGSDRLERKGLH